MGSSSNRWHFQNPQIIPLKQGSATYGPPSKIIRPAAPLQIAVLVLHTYYELLYLWEIVLCYTCTICHILGLRYELWKSGVNLIKITKIITINNKMNGIVGVNLYGPPHLAELVFGPRKVADPCTKAICYNNQQWGNSGRGPRIQALLQSLRLIRRPCEIGVW